MFNFKSLKSDFTLTRNNIPVFKPDTTLHTAFTLAEVLITLGIIGVVAAMTLPTLMNNVKNKELHSGLVKAYSAIQNAVQQIQAEDGTIVTDYTDTGFGHKIKPYFVISKDCSIGSHENCLDANMLKSTYKTYSNKTIQYYLLDDGQFFTQDGMFFMIENPSSVNRMYISVDINGPYKNPNRWGFDLFTFQLMSDGKIMPMGAENTDYENAQCSKTGTGDFNGVGCTYKALYDKNYWRNLP